MNAVGMLLLAAATATSTFDGFGYDKPFVHGRKLLRPHAVMHGPAPAGGMIGGPGMAAAGCAFGHPGCAGGESCPGAAGMGGAGGPGGAAGRRFPNVRSQLFFVAPVGMKVGWQTAAGGGERVYMPAQLTVPARYNFPQGYIYRLKITDLGANRPGLVLYPTIEVAPSTLATDAYLTHNPIPVQFTEEDFDQVAAGNFVTKVIYLPDPKYQELAIAGVETLVSTRLEPGIDPILEADRRGTILLIIRLGGIDLEMPQSNPGVVVGPVTDAGGAPLMLNSGVIAQPGVLGQPGAYVSPGPVTYPDSAPAAPMVPNSGGALPVEPLDTSAPVTTPPSTADDAPATLPDPAPGLPEPGAGLPEPGAGLPEPATPGLEPPPAGEAPAVEPPAGPGL
jgi:hypothetical protein